MIVAELITEFNQLLHEVEHDRAFQDRWNDICDRLLEAGVNPSDLVGQGPIDASV